MDFQEAFVIEIVNMSVSPKLIAHRFAGRLTMRTTIHILSLMHDMYGRFAGISAFNDCLDLFTVDGHDLLPCHR